MINYLRWIVYYYVPIKPFRRWLWSKWAKELIPHIPQISEEQAFRRAVIHFRQPIKHNIVFDVDKETVEKVAKRLDATFEDLRFHLPEKND